MLLDDHHGTAVLLGDAADRVEERLDHERGEAHAHLVDEQHARLLDERPRHDEHLLLATGEGPDLQVPALLERGEDVEHVAWLRAPPPGRDLEVLGHRQGGEEAAVVGHEDDTGRIGPGRASRAQGRAVDLDRAGQGGQQPGDREEHRRLAGAVRAEQCQHLATVDPEVDVAERDERAATARQRRAGESNRHSCASATTADGPGCSVACRLPR